MAIQIDKIALAFAHLGQIRQATSDAAIRTLLDSAADTLAEDCIVICDEVDPAADLKKIRFDQFYAAIDECNAIADASNSETVKASCFAIVESLTAVIKKLI